MATTTDPTRSCERCQAKPATVFIPEPDGVGVLYAWCEPCSLGSPDWDADPSAFESDEVVCPSCGARIENRFGAAAELEAHACPSSEGPSEHDGNEPETCPSHGTVLTGEDGYLCEACERL